jgi:hypothetical protein
MIKFPQLCLLGTAGVILLQSISAKSADAPSPVGVSQKFVCSFRRDPIGQADVSITFGAYDSPIEFYWRSLPGETMTLVSQEGGGAIYHSAEAYEGDIFTELFLNGDVAKITRQSPKFAREYWDCKRKKD